MREQNQNERQGEFSTEQHFFLIIIIIRCYRTGEEKKRFAFKFVTPGEKKKKRKARWLKNETMGRVTAVLGRDRRVMPNVCVSNK